MTNNRRMGIYTSWIGPKDWKFDIYGHFINKQNLTSLSDKQKNICLTGLKVVGDGIKMI